MRVAERPDLASGEPAAANGGAALPPPDTRRVWTAEIKWRHGGGRSRFCVMARAVQGDGEVTVAQSPPLDWPPKDPASVRAVSEAAERLEATVLAAGWTALPRGGAWYAKRFTWEPNGSGAAEPGVVLGPTSPSPAVPIEPVGAAEPADADVDASGGEARRASKLPAAMVVVLLAAAAITGHLLAGAVGRDDATAVRPPPPAIAHGGLLVQVPDGWARGDAAPVRGFSRPLGLRNAGERLSAVVERLPATSATLLPVAFERTLTARGRPEVVRLASGQSAWRYRFPQGGGPVTVVYAAATTSGVATLACVGPTSPGVPRGCEALARGLTVPGSNRLDLGTRGAFFSRLPATVSDLDTARTRGMRELSAATRATGQAAAAEGLVRAHRGAVAALAPLTNQHEELTTETVGALSATATAYATLASAARARSPRRYAAAGRTVGDADARLRRTLTRAASAAAAASRAATRAASERAVSRPAATTSAGVDLTLPLLALLGVGAMFLAVRATVRRGR